MANAKPSNKPKKEISGIAKTYLIGYNFIETIGWSYILYLLVNYHLSSSKTQSLYDMVKWSLIIFQNAAVLEVVHTLIRIVPSNPLITAMQVASRVIVVCGVILATKAGRETIGLHLALAAWSITEIIRYGNYTLNLTGGVPHIVTWLRYTTFIILYPIGVTGELLCIYAAQKEVGEKKIFTIEMPNALNFTFDYQKVLWGLMFLYIPLFPKLYMHMWTLRRKVLGGGQQKKDK
ncbi:very-long-chain (3R)-3-hydroxyacyl-CoA dehydratase hpo-8 [Tribolium madens]|uniref:very-long-chain (3R)-3-hydroxyacyl-CoA dehydratase hpo-8 n=1 Tax=Tribolium madens TaxID=41895 RepID=UPI001CF7415A|nr:very-long-chain (3R)-3-hydroxyacyl-CoA dehydratase hpo-8 [Tribolium madens]